MWSPTNESWKPFRSSKFSIHGLRVEPDISKYEQIDALVAFQSTGSVWSPTTGSMRWYAPNIFQSTGSVWSPTYQLWESGRGSRFSIHGLRVEPDY